MWWLYTSACVYIYTIFIEGNWFIITLTVCMSITELITFSLQHQPANDIFGFITALKTNIVGRYFSLTQSTQEVSLDRK